MANDNQSNAPKVSALHVHSFGIIAANKPLGSAQVEVFAVEDFPTTSGVVSDNASSYTVSGMDAKGNAYTDQLTQAVSKPATWMPFGSNRMTPPDVRKGERVMLWRFGDTDKYYWATLADDMNLRKLETAVYAWSGTPNEGDSTNADTSYFFEVSTHNKLMHVHTSKQNGELCSYDIQLNPGTGKFQFQDDLGTVFLIDSANGILNYQNSSGSQINISKGNATWQVPDTWQVIAKKGQLVFTESLTVKTPMTNHLGDFNEYGAFGLAGDMVTQPSVAGTGGTPGTGQMTIAASMKLAGDAVIVGKTTTLQLTSTEAIIAPNVP